MIIVPDVLGLKVKAGPQKFPWIVKPFITVPFESEITIPFGEHAWFGLGQADVLQGKLIILSNPRVYVFGFTLTFAPLMIRLVLASIIIVLVRSIGTFPEVIVIVSPVLSAATIASCKVV